jgi:magnesium-transporting ATPase (P-type)
LPEESGSSTEIALLKFIDRCQYDIQDIRAKNEIIQKMPFSSSRKRMSKMK